MCHPHICTFLYNLVNCFFPLSNCLLQHPERSQITVRRQFVECTQRSFRHGLGIILQLCEHFLLSLSIKSVLLKHTPYCHLKLLAITLPIHFSCPHNSNRFDTTHVSQSEFLKKLSVFKSSTDQFVFQATQCSPPLLNFKVIVLVSEKVFLELTSVVLGHSLLTKTWVVQMGIHKFNPQMS